MVKVKDGGDASYRDCFTDKLSSGHFKPFIMVASDNFGEKVNDIDIDAMYIKNYD